MKKLLALLIAMAMTLTSLTVSVFGEKGATPNEFMRIREELMQEQMKQAGKSDRFIIKYKTSEAKQNAVAAVQSAFSKEQAKNAMERQQLESKISNFSGHEKEELSMLTAPLLEVGRNVRENKLRNDSKLKVTSSLTDVIALTEAVDSATFINSVKSDMGSLVEYIQEDVKMEMSADSDQGELYGTGMDSFSGNAAIVAVIDTGVDVTHPLLSSRMTAGYDFVSSTANVYNPALGSEQDHGTHISGIIAATAENVQIMPLKVFESGTAYTSDIITAIEHAEANGASVVNCSWGATGENPALREAMENSSMFFVCAAGNSRLDLNQTPIYPAAFNLPNTISVASVNQDLGMSYYSNYGSVDIAAKGRDINSAIAGGGKGNMNGTSMAAAFVSAAAALTDETDIKSALKTGADKLSCLTGKVNSGNYLNISNVVSSALGQALTVMPEDDFDRWFEKTPAESWELFNSSPTVQVAAGGDHTVVLKANGTVWAWGYNGYGQLGNGSLTYPARETIPTQVVGLTKIQAVAASWRHTVALDTDGCVWAWGSNSNGQVGNGYSGWDWDVWLPYKISNIPNNMAMQAITAGAGFTAALGTDGYVYAWGDNSDGQIGTGSAGTDVLTPHKVTTMPNNMAVQAISAGDYFTVALGLDGYVYAWGNNYYGHINSNSPGTNVLTPYKITNISNIQAVAAGSFRTVALGNDGYVYAWGSNHYGQIGNGSTADAVLTPYKIESIPNVQAISVGFAHTAAVDTDGYAYVWGYNSDGQVGNDSSGTDVLSPNKITSIPNVQAIAAGRAHTVVLDAEGYIYAWGDNYYGQVGDGTTIDRHTPKMVTDFNIYSNEYSITFKLNNSLIEILTGNGTVEINTEIDGVSNAVLLATVHKKNGNTVVSSDYQAKPISQNSTETFTATVNVPSNHQDYYVRVMVWDSLADMKQIQRSIIMDSTGISIGTR